MALAKELRIFMFPEGSPLASNPARTAAPAWKWLQEDAFHSMRLYSRRSSARLVIRMKILQGVIRVNVTDSGNKRAQMTGHDASEYSAIDECEHSSFTIASRRSDGSVRNHAAQIAPLAPDMSASGH